MDIKELMAEAYKIAQSKEKNRSLTLRADLAHIREEANEAVDEYWKSPNNKAIRFECDDLMFDCGLDEVSDSCGSECEHAKPCGLPIELADIIIRVLSTCADKNIDIIEAIKVKMDYNRVRKD